MGTPKGFLIVLLLAVVFAGTLQAEDRPPAKPEASGGKEVGLSAGGAVLGALVTAVNIPLRTVLCVADAGMGFVVMSASAGRSYVQAAEIVEAGCAGPWFIGARTIEEGRRKKTDDINKAFLAAHPK